MNALNRWSKQQAWDWYREYPYLCGFNYLPSTAVNSTEMWQAETFNSPTIERELGWAQKIGLNCCRVFVQYLVWEADSAGLLERMERFLDIADYHKIVTLFILLDDCAFAGKEPYLGPQASPVPGVHNSGWTASPGANKTRTMEYWSHLEDYISDVIGRLSKDRRVLAWDIYNEPGNNNLGVQSLPLLVQSFEWARAAEPTQPLTSGIWNFSHDFTDINDFLSRASDIITFHEYSDLSTTRSNIARLKSFEYPLLCTEWMARTFHSTFATHLPFFREEGIGNFFWGLVNGRTQTHFPWGSPEGAGEPPVWFHDLLHGDGTPYDEAEVVLLRERLPPSAEPS